MYCPKLSELKTSRSTERVFRGYNHNAHVGEGEFYEMENLSSDHYPLISPRPPRGTFAAPALAQGMIAREKLCYIDGGDFIMDGERTAMGLTVDGTPKTMVSLGTYVIVLPDKKYINTADTSDHGAIEASFTTTDLIRYHMCREDGKPYPEVTVSIVAPGNPEDLSYWLDTSTEPNVLKQYFEARDTWMTIPKTYVRIYSSGIGLPFSEGDGVTLSGILNEKLTELNGRVVIVARAKDYIVVPGMLEKSGEQTANCPIHQL